MNDTIQIAAPDTTPRPAAAPAAAPPNPPQSAAPESAGAEAEAVTFRRRFSRSERPRKAGEVLYDFAHAIEDAEQVFFLREFSREEKEEYQALSSGVNARVQALQNEAIALQKQVSALQNEAAALLKDDPRADTSELEAREAEFLEQAQAARFEERIDEFTPEVEAAFDLALEGNLVGWCYYDVKTGKREKTGALITPGDLAEIPYSFKRDLAAALLDASGLSGAQTAPLGRR